MQLGGFHLTYCTNIHPGAGWPEVFANLKIYAPELKRRLAPGRPFGLGLRLSAQECEELLAEGPERFRAFLSEQGLYVALINGFVHGGFHRRRVKECVFAPDWADKARVAYTLRLLKVAKSLLPEGLDGGISTSPLSYKRWGSQDARVLEAITHNLVHVAETMARLAQEEAKLVHLDIEPEPDGLVENSEELATFYHEWLLPVGGRLLADSLRISVERAQELLLEHIRVCYDTCHLAVEREEPEEVLGRFAELGIKIGRVQVSSALELRLPDERPQRTRLAAQLGPFAESVYLHQVVEERDGQLRRYPDLADALATVGEAGARRWRIHFHVPLFVSQFGTLDSTQPYIRRTLQLLRERPFTYHLEIETYTWDVLPADLKLDLLDSIEREYRWVLNQLQVPAGVEPEAG